MILSHRSTIAYLSFRKYQTLYYGGYKPSLQLNGMN